MSVRSKKTTVGQKPYDINRRMVERKFVQIQRINPTHTHTHTYTQMSLFFNTEIIRAQTVIAKMH